MNLYRKLGKTASVLFLALAMAGCGGGEMAVNTAPSLMLGPGGAIDEDMTGSTGLAVTATDEDGDEIMLTVSDARFAVVGGVLTVVAGTMLDHEMESSITVEITASDGDLSDTKMAEVTVRNVDDNAPTLNLFGTRGSILEGETGGTGLVFMADDNDMLDNLRFSTDVEGFSVADLGGGRYELQVDNALDREMTESVSVFVTATDGAGSTTTPIPLIIAVGNVDDTNPMLGMRGMGAIDENDEDYTGVTFKPTDADGDALFNFFIGGDHFDHFRVVPAGFQTYALQVSEAFDYEEVGGTVSVTVTVVDSVGLHDEATFEVTINDENDNAPMITTTGSAAIDEEETGSTMLMLTVTDDDTDAVNDATMWTVTDDRFEIDAMGYLRLKEGQEIDYDGADGETSVMLTVTANDGKHNSMAEAITVTINPVNDNTPMISVDETGKMTQMEGTFDAATSTGVTVEVTDGDNDMVTPMVTGDPRFAIDAMGNLTIVAGSMFDYEMMADQSIDLMITAMDDGGLEATSQPVTVMFTDVNDSAPMLTVTDNKGGTAVTEVTRPETRHGETESANKPTDHKILVSDADTHDTPMPMVSDDRFYIDPDTGYLMIKADAAFNHEDPAGNVIVLEITADDGKNEVAKYEITFNIANLDEAPIITPAAGDRSPERVMGPYGDGYKDVITLTATDPDNPDDPYVVRWSTRTNPNTDVWTWTENDDGDMYTLGMKAGTFLGKGGPAAQVADNDTTTDVDEEVSYTGYTADDAGNLKRHVVDVDDAELDQRAVVVPMQIVDTIVTSPALAMYGTYSVAPSKAHVDNATQAERTAGKPGMETFIPNFEELTGGSGGPGNADTNDYVHMPASGTTPADIRLLNDAEIHDGITRSTLGGSNYGKAAVQSQALTDAGVTVPATNAAQVAAAYRTNMVSPENPVPMEPMGLDIVTDTRAVDVTTGAIKTGQELAVRYRFASDGAADTEDPAQRDYNVDVALIDNSGMVLEEYRDATAYSTTLAATTLTASTSSIEVDVSSLSYARYGLWAYNNLRMCSTCPQGSEGPAGGGLRGATAFGMSARAGDLNTQDHVGVWDGTTVAMWGNKAADGSIDASTLQSGLTGGTAKIAVNFNNDKVQANMAVASHRFEFDGTLNADNLGYTASVNTTIPGGAGAIAAVTGGGTAGQLSTGYNLSVDSANNIHATGMLSGAFYGPTSAVGSTVANAKASAETAGTWQITDVPDIDASDDTSTVVIGAFGASLVGNVRIGNSTVGGTDVLTGIHTGQTGERIGIADDE